MSYNPFWATRVSPNKNPFSAAKVSQDQQQDISASDAAAAAPVAGARVNSPTGAYLGILGVPGSGATAQKPLGNYNGRNPLSLPGGLAQADAAIAEQDKKKRTQFYNSRSMPQGYGIKP